MYTLTDIMDEIWSSFMKRWKVSKVKKPTQPKPIKTFAVSDVENCRLNGVSLLIFVNFYAALDTFMDEVYGDLLLTHRSVYITHFKYINRYQMFVAYDHVNAGYLSKEYVINLNGNAMAKFLKVKNQLVEIMLASKQTEDSPFRQIV